MLLAVDVGNSNTVFGVFGHGESGTAPRAHFRLETRKGRTADEYAVALHQLFALAGLPWKVDGGIVATVVPPALFAVEDFFRRHLGVQALVVGHGIKTGMPILYDSPRDVGADRICDA